RLDRASRRRGRPALVLRRGRAGGRAGGAEADGARRGRGGRRAAGIDAGRRSRGAAADLHARQPGADPGQGRRGVGTVSEDARIGVEDLEALATGAAFLGAGGGGDPYIGRLLAKHAVETCGMPEIVQPEDLPDDAQVFTAAMIGAPTVLIEKGASGEEIDRSLTRMAEITGRKPDAISP